MSRPQMDRRDWGKLSVGEQIEQIEVEGYLVLPDLLSSEDIAQLRLPPLAWTRHLSTTASVSGVDRTYSSRAARLLG